MHHLGYVVPSIAACVDAFAASVAASWSGRIFDDPRQQARVSFLTPAHPGEPLLELVEPWGQNSHLMAHLRRGGGMHHVCYEVMNLESTLRRSEELGDKIVRSAQPAVAFGGRSIAWVFTRQRLLLEFLAAPSAKATPNT